MLTQVSRCHGITKSAILVTSKTKHNGSTLAWHTLQICLCNFHSTGASYSHRILCLPDVSTHTPKTHKASKEYLHLAIQEPFPKCQHPPPGAFRLKHYSLSRIHGLWLLCLSLTFQNLFLQIPSCEPALQVMPVPSIHYPWHPPYAKLEWIHLCCCVRLGKPLFLHFTYSSIRSHLDRMPPRVRPLPDAQDFPE